MHKPPNEYIFCTEVNTQKEKNKMLSKRIMGYFRWGGQVRLF